MKRNIAALFIATALLASVAAPVLLAPGSARVAAAGGHVQRALDYLRGRQKTDGGFAEPGRDSSDQLTGWVVSAIAAAGEDPNSWRVAGKSPLDYLSSNAGNWISLADLERSCLAVSSAGADPRSFGGRNLVAEISGQIKSDGHLGRMINDHCWGLIALAAAGEPIPVGCRNWLVSMQNIDGGFSFAAESASDPDDTGAAMQALVAAGESPEGNAMERAASYLRFCQSSDGGFRWQSTSSNVASTAWAVQGLSAAGEDADGVAWSKSGNTPLDFLRGMQQADGHIKYSDASDSNPAWMTAEAVPALLKRPYPLNYAPKAPESSESPSDSSDSPRTPTTATDPVVSEWTGITDEALVPFPGDVPGEESAPEVAADGEPKRSSDSSGAGSSGSPDDSGNLFAMSAPGGGSGSGSNSESIPLFLIICGSYIIVLGLITLGLKIWRNPQSY